MGTKHVFAPGDFPTAANLNAIAGPLLCTSATHPTGSALYVGLEIFETDTGKLLVYQSATTGFTPPWNTAWGRIGSVSLGGSDQTGITGATNLTGSGISVTVVANRRIRLSASIPLLQVTSTGQINVYFFRSSAIGWVGDISLGAGARYRTAGVMEDNPAAGSYTYLLQGTTSAGTLTIENSRNAGYFIVEDMGSTGAPV